MPIQTDWPRRTRASLTLRHLLVTVTTAMALTTLGSTAFAAQDQGRTVPRQPEAADPIMVVEDFLSARNARDPFGATYFTAPLLLVHDADGQWIADGPATQHWLRQLTDTYVVDMLVKPHAAGDTVAWVERLAPRSMPFPDALHESMEVGVEVVVQDGKITSYTAPYPVLPPQPSRAATQSASSRPSTSAPAVPPSMLFVSSALVLVVSVLLVMNLGPAISRVRRST